MQPPFSNHYIGSKKKCEFPTHHQPEKKTLIIVLFPSNQFAPRSFPNSQSRLRPTQTHTHPETRENSQTIIPKPSPHTLPTHPLWVWVAVWGVKVALFCVFPVLTLHPKGLYLAIFWGGGWQRCWQILKQRIKLFSPPPLFFAGTCLRCDGAVDGEKLAKETRQLEMKLSLLVN